MSDPISEQAAQDSLLDDIIGFVGEPQEAAPTDNPQDYSDDDPFGLGGFTQGAPVKTESEEGEVTGQGVPQEPLNPSTGTVDDPNSYKYFQSKYDQAEADRRVLQQRIDEQSRMLAQYQGGQSFGQQPVNQGGMVVGQPYQESYAPLQMPVKPEMPADFDRIDGQTDPDSDSWKYLQAMDGYRDQQSEFVMQTLARREYEEQLRQEQYQEQAQTAQYKVELRDKFKMDDESINDFLKVMDDPAMLTMENLYALYRHVRGQPFVQTSQPTHRPSPPNPTIPVPPLPASTSSGANRPPKNGADKLMDDLVAMSNQQAYRL